jgi:hypothetical protein
VVIAHPPVLKLAGLKAPAALGAILLRSGVPSKPANTGRRSGREKGSRDAKGASSASAKLKRALPADARNPHMARRRWVIHRRDEISLAISHCNNSVTRCGIHRRS